MRYKQLGNTGVAISEIGIGTWMFRGEVAALRRGIELGVNFIDTAESYGNEEVVGQAIKGIRNRVLLASKVSPAHFRYSDVINAAEQSLRRLQTDRIDLYQLHWPNYTVPVQETLAAMERLVETGKVRFIGVSKFFGIDLKSATLALSRYKIVSNQVGYSLVERTIEGELLADCEKRHITVLAFSPLAGCFDRIRAADPNDILGHTATECSKTRAQVALRWCVVRPSVVAITKASSIAHVTENCTISDWDLSIEQIRALNVGIRFRRRGRLEIAMRRMAQYVVQRTGLNRHVLAGTPENQREASYVALDTE